MKTAAEFFEEKIKYETTPFSVNHLLDAKDSMHFIVDVRDEGSYKKGHLPGAINIPAGELDKSLAKMPKDKKIILYCYDILCFAAPKAALKLALKGYEVSEMLGGFDEWKKRDMPVEKGK